MFGPEYDQILELTRGLQPTANTLIKLSKNHPAELVQWGFTQWRLRERAKNKLEESERLWLDQDGLEMASSSAAATFHASLFPPEVTVADLACGLGSDLSSLAKRGPAVGFDLAPTRAEYARRNLGVWDAGAEVLCANSLEHDWDFEYAFCDPSRRQDGTKSSALEQGSPSPLELLEKAKQSDCKQLVLKLSPMLPDSSLKHFSSPVYFVGSKDHCLEAVVDWSPNREDEVWAVHLPSQTRTRSKMSYLPITEEIGPYLYHAHPCAIRADLLGQLADSLDLEGLGDSNGYLTGELVKDHEPWLRAFRVLGSSPGDVKQLQKVIDELGVYVQDVKDRAGVDSATILKKLKRRGKHPANLAAYPVGDSVRYAIVEPQPVKGN